MCMLKRSTSLLGVLTFRFGRGETFIVVTILYVVGYLLIATADGIAQIAGGEIFYVRAV